MIWRHLVTLVATIIVAGCGMVPHVPGPGDLGVPAKIGDWTVSDITPDPKTDFGKGMAEFVSGFMEAAGATSATGAWGMFEVRDAGNLVIRVDGYRVIGAEPEAIWRGADSIGFGDASPVAITAMGWDLRRLGDDAGWVAARGDRLFTFLDGPPRPTRDQVLSFLEAMN